MLYQMNRHVSVERTSSPRYRGLATRGTADYQSALWTCLGSWPPFLSVRLTFSLPINLILLRVTDPRSGARLCEAQQFSGSKRERLRKNLSTNPEIVSLICKGLHISGSMSSFAPKRRCGVPRRRKCRPARIQGHELRFPNRERGHGIEFSVNSVY